MSLWLPTQSHRNGIPVPDYIRGKNFWNKLLVQCLPNGTTGINLAKLKTDNFLSLQVFDTGEFKTAWDNYQQLKVNGPG